MGLIAANEHAAPELIELNNISHTTLVKKLVVEAVAAPASPSILALFKQLVPKSAELISSFIPSLTKFVDTSDAPKLDNRQRRKLLEQLRKVNFLAYEDTVIFVPEGFKGKFALYLDVLLDQGKTLIDEGKKTLSDYNAILSRFLSDSDIRQSLDSHDALYKNVRQNLHRYQAVVQTFFDKNHSTVSRQKLKTVIDRFSDLDKVFLLEERLINQRKQQDYKTILEEVKHAADLLKLIKHRLDAGDIAGVSSQMARNLAEGAYEVARYTEYMAIYGYYVETILAAINSTAEKLDDLV